MTYGRITRYGLIAIKSGGEQPDAGPITVVVVSTSGKKKLNRRKL